MTSAPRVTVAGAGVLGLSTALALADAGARVTVHDPGGPNASSVAAGMIAPAFEAVLDATARPHFDLLMAARDHWPWFAERAGIALDRSGAMAVGEADWLATLAAGFAALHLRPTEVGGDTARSLAPGLSEAVDRALLTREDWRVDAPAALAALVRAAEAAGVIFRPEPVRERGDADVLIVATGAHGRHLADLAPELAGLNPVKGHIVRVAAPSAGAVVRARSVYAAPGASMVFGATMEHGRADVAVDEQVAGPLLAAGLDLFPACRDAPVQVAAGVRAATADGLPMVGPAAAPGVLLAVGARRNGWLLAPLVARTITACVTGRDLGPHAARFDPARFSRTS
ncbi:MAG: FAD-dependent oxidoreductase [Phenylobacterium sp.]|uniref:NAD(P)/FAD-dependent oxidoreductase n=1 Tax=Phenylobacterium sp. TaxID=1871053 RepID=UPI0025FBFB0B|nr:FAD-dependent oxidoreductase [Phenylobacterium sp.]MBI1196326.1 FAD-dependent oxidoreductase [Phenylobacterium sp.]